MNTHISSPLAEEIAQIVRTRTLKLIAIDKMMNKQEATYVDPFEDRSAGSLAGLSDEAYADHHASKIIAAAKTKTLSVSLDGNVASLSDGTNILQALRLTKRLVLALQFESLVDSAYNVSNEDTGYLIADFLGSLNYHVRSGRVTSDKLVSSLQHAIESTSKTAAPRS